MIYTCPDCGVVYETDEIEDLKKDSEYEWEFICTNPNCKGAFKG